MAIVVSGVPDSRKTPDVYLEVSPGTSGAGGTGQKTSVLVGQGLATGSMSAGDVETCQNTTEAISLGGQGSELHLMAKGFFATNSGGVLSLAMLTPGTTASTRTIVFVNAATANGYYYVWCNGNKYSLTITNGDGIDNMADNLAAGIAAESWYGDLPFTVASDGVDTVTFTTKNLGPQSQWAVWCIHDKDSELPGTTTATLSAVGVSGGSDPTVTTCVTALTPASYDLVGWSNTDATAITAIESYIDTQVGPLVGFRQQSVLGSADNYVNTKTMAQTNANHKRLQVAWSESDNETYFEMVGRVVGLRANKEAGDPAYPYNRTVLSGYRVASATNLYPTPTEIENALNNSITPIGVSSGNGVVVRGITSYSLNGATPDYTCLDTACVTVPDYMADVLDSVMSARWSSSKGAADYTEPTDTPRGVVTPRMVKDVIFMELKRAEQKAIVSEITAAVKAQIDADYPGTPAGRINFECPVPVMNGLYVVAGNVRGY